jgi:hypothetical protein
MVYDITSSDNKFTCSLSYNHSVFSDIWYVKEDLDGKTASVVLEHLKRAITELRAAGFEAPAPGELSNRTCWTITELVRAGFVPPDELKNKPCWSAGDLLRAGFTLTKKMYEQDCWTTNENVFMYFLIMMRAKIKSYIRQWPSHADAIYTID